MFLSAHTRSGAPFPLLVGVVSVVAAIACSSTSGSRGSGSSAGSPDTDPRATRQRVQSQLMAFSDRFFAVVHQAAWQFQERAGTPIARQDAARERLAALLATTDIAAGPEPGSGLLDMTVMVTLKRMVWEDYWVPEVYGDPGQIMVEAFRTLETDIWQVVNGVFSPEQQQELRKVIADWRAHNPDQVSIGYLRLAELGDARQISSLVAAGKPGGMLAPIREANRNIEEMRLLAERLVFMLNRLQLVLNYQVDFAYSKLAMEPEVQQVLANVQTFAEVAERLSATFERTIDELPHEREAAIEQALAGLRAEREALLADLTSEDEGLRPALGDVRDTLELGRQLAGVLNETMLTAERLMAHMAEGDEPAARPFDILEYQAALVQATATLQEMQLTLTSVEQILDSSGLEKQLPQIIEGANRLEEEVANEILNRAFVRGAALILIFFVALFLYRLAVRHL